MNPIEISLTQEQLFPLGAKASTLGTLSPFLPRSSEQEQMAQSRIISPSLVTGSGEIQPQFLPAFQVLSDPAAFVYLTYIGRAVNIECSCYYQDPIGSGDPVTLVADGENLVISHPGMIGQLREILREYIGNSVIRPLDYDLSFPLADAWVFLAVLDASRQQILETHLQYKTPDSLELTKKAVEDAVRADSSSLQWLSPYFAQCLSLAKLSGSDIKISLENLAGQGLLEVSGDKVLPGRLLQAMAIEYLVSDGHLRLRSDLMRDGEQLTTDLRAVQGRTGAIMVWSFDEASVDLTGLSPAEFMLTIQGLTENPSLHLGGSPAQPAAAEKTPPPESL